MFGLTNDFSIEILQLTFYSLVLSFSSKTAANHRHFVCTKMNFRSPKLEFESVKNSPLTALHLNGFRSDTISDIQISALAGPRIRGFLRRANTTDEMGTDERDRLREDDESDDRVALSPIGEKPTTGDDTGVTQAFNHFLSYPGILEEDPFTVGIHVPGDFDSLPANLQEKV